LRSNLICRGIFEDFHAGSKGNLYSKIATPRFGLNADQVVKVKMEGYHPSDFYHGDPELKATIDLLNSGLFSHGDTELFRPLTGSPLAS
jgi:glucan phosphorylase